MSQNPESEQGTQTHIAPAQPVSGSGNTVMKSPFGELPCKFGKYTIEQKLGSGRMGAVFLARDTVIERRVALKVPSSQVLRDPKWAERFLQEAKTAAKIEHPQVCRIWDAERIDKIPYLTMEYIAGQTLEDHLKSSGPLSSEQAAAWCEKMAIGLEQAHSRNILHRDLKPANIMVRAGSHELVIMDFGLAVQWHLTDARMGQSTGLSGTPLYMAPELFADNPDAITPVSEVFSLGVILFEMLTGKRPFGGKNLNEVIAQITTREPASPVSLKADVDPALAAICLKMLSKDPDERHGSAAEVARVLNEWSQQHPGERGGVCPPVNSRRNQEADASRSLVSVVVVSVLAVAVLFGVWWSVFRSDVSPQTVPLSSNGSITKSETGGSSQPEGPKEIAPPKTVPEKSSEPTQEALKALVPDNSKSAVATLPKLHIDLQRAGETKTFARLTSQHLPIRDGDKVHVRAELPTPAFACLFWYDADGKANRLWPESLDQQKPVEEVWSPLLAQDAKDQLWHEVGGTGGLEMFLVVISQSPFDEAVLSELEQRRVELAYLDRQNALAAFDTERGSVGTVKSEKASSAIDVDKDSSPAMVLLVSEKADRELVRVTSLTAPDDDSVRGPTGKVRSPKEFQQPDFRDQLRKFDSYYGVVFRHENQ